MGCQGLAVFALADIILPASPLDGLRPSPRERSRKGAHAARYASLERLLADLDTEAHSSRAGAAQEKRKP